MRENFDTCLSHVLRHEGGYVDHPRDPGSATNMGITQRTLSDWRGYPVSKAQVRALGRDEVAAIYRARYWNAVRGDDLPAGLDLVAFDGAVNSGPLRGAQWLQTGLGVTADGKIGPLTLRAAASCKPADAINRACDARLGFLRRLGTWATFGRGWTSRVADVRSTALRMAAASAMRPDYSATPPPPPSVPLARPAPAAGLWAWLASIFTRKG